MATLLELQPPKQNWATTYSRRLDGDPPIIESRGNGVSRIPRRRDGGSTMSATSHVLQATESSIWPCSLSSSASSSSVRPSALPPPTLNLTSDLLDSPHLLYRRSRPPAALGRTDGRSGGITNVGLIVMA